MIAGWLASLIGSGKTVVATGLLTLALVFVFGRRISRIKPAKVTAGADGESPTEIDPEMAGSNLKGA